MWNTQDGLHYRCRTSSVRVCAFIWNRNEGGKSDALIVCQISWHHVVKTTVNLFSGIRARRTIYRCLCLLMQSSRFHCWWNDSSKWGKKHILRLIATHKMVEIYFVVIAAILIKFLLSHVRSLEDLVACDAWLYHTFSGPSYYWIINVVESIDGGETCLEMEFISNFLLNFRSINFIYYSKNCTVRYKKTNIRLTQDGVTMVTWLANQQSSEKQI